MNSKIYFLKHLSEGGVLIFESDLFHSKIKDAKIVFLMEG